MTGKSDGDLAPLETQLPSVTQVVVVTLDATLAETTRHLREILEEAREARRVPGRIAEPNQQVWDELIVTLEQIVASPGEYQRALRKLAESNFVRGIRDSMKRFNKTAASDDFNISEAAKLLQASIAELI